MDADSCELIEKWKMEAEANSFGYCSPDFGSFVVFFWFFGRGLSLQSQNWENRRRIKFDGFN